MIIIVIIKPNGIDEKYNALSLFLVNFIFHNPQRYLVYDVIDMNGGNHV